MRRLRINWIYLLTLPLLATSFGACPGPREIHFQAVRLADSLSKNLGVAPITRAQVKQWVDNANEVWEFTPGIRFVFDDSPTSDDFITWSHVWLNSVPSDEREDWTYKVSGNLFAQIWYPDSVVVFFRARGGGGWSWGPPDTCYVSMPSWTNTSIDKPNPGQWNPNPTLLSHELGHYSGLAHTFGGITDCSKINQTNMDGDAGGQDPYTTADDVTDTDADTNLCLPGDCLTNPVTINGQSWYIPWKNVMSYHDCYPEQFSADQIRAINHTYEHPKRSPLLN